MTARLIAVTDEYCSVLLRPNLAEVEQQITSINRMFTRVAYSCFNGQHASLSLAVMKTLHMLFRRKDRSWQISFI